VGRQIELTRLALPVDKELEAIPQLRLNKKFWFSCVIKLCKCGCNKYLLIE
jgi:hypothetical protein